MAVDTRNKRMSMIGLASPVPRVLPNPDGAFTAPDRQQLLYEYSGIANVTPPVGSGTVNNLPRLNVGS